MFLYVFISDECKYLNMFPTEIQMELDPSLNITILSKYIKLTFQSFNTINLFIKALSYLL